MQGLICNLRQLGARLEDLVLPHVCAACRKAIGTSADELCEDCSRELMRLVGGAYCRSCGTHHHPHMMIDGRCNDCRVKKPGQLRFDYFACVGHYAGVLRTLILRLKREIVVERLLGGLLADAVGGRFNPAKVDLWVPVPSHWRRRLSRGFQPTGLLTDRVARRWGARSEPVLIAASYVPPFHIGPMTMPQRVAAIKGAFKVAQGVSLRGRTVCLVDDVSTTGATLAEARLMLSKAGARHIYAAVIAKAAHFPGMPIVMDDSVLSASRPFD